MIKQSRQSKNKFAIKCQCTIFHNTLQLNSKKKSKLSNIELRDIDKMLIITPKGQSDIYQLPIQKLKIIHKKFIDEGKITLQYQGMYMREVFSQSSEQPRKQIRKTTLNPSLETNIQKKIPIQKYLDGNSQIFINNGSKQNLQILIKYLVQAKKKHLETNKQIKTSQKQQPCKQKQQQKKLKKQFISSINRDEQKMASRKDLTKIIKNHSQPITKINNQPKIKSPQNSYQPQITLLSIPKILLKEIFSYIGIHLDYRLICKEIEKFVIMSITSIKLHDQIQENAFNKLAKYALNVRCRMKNVKTLQLMDRFEDPQLQINRAKCLDFGQWKQIGAKNIHQLKGLKIYSLSVYYGIKFDFNNFYGLRLVQLRLKSLNNTYKNSYIKDQQIIYLINNINQLSVIEIPHITSKLITQIKSPKKMKQIKIQTLNVIHSDQKWQNMTKFQKLKVLQISQIVRNSTKIPYHEFSIDWPEQLVTLEIGYPITRQCLAKIPYKLKHLKMNGQFVRNQVLEQLYLPQLKLLDISQSPNLTPQFLQNFTQLRVISSWDRSRVDYANNYFVNSRIQISSTRCYTPYN